MNVFIVTAWRWGNPEDHHYSLGAFTDFDKAKEVANSHKAFRGGKYECVVEECQMDHFDNDDEDYTKEVYDTAHP